MDESITREEDRKSRLDYLHQMRDALVAGCPITAKMCGEISRLLAERIATKDYAQADAWLAHEKKVLGYNPK